MKQRDFIGLSTVAIAGALGARPAVLQADIPATGRNLNTDKKLSPNTQWLREAKWGLFTHYLAHMPSARVPRNMTGEFWNKNGLPKNWSIFKEKI